MYALNSNSPTCIWNMHWHAFLVDKEAVFWRLKITTYSLFNDDAVLTILKSTGFNYGTRNTKEMQNYTGEKSILAVFEEILLKSCLEHSKLQKDKTKVTEGGGKTPPVPGQGLTRSQNSCRIEFSSKNGREISSSVYGTTRWPQL